MLALVDQTPASARDRMVTGVALLPHRAATRGLDIYEVINLFVYLESAFVGDPHEQRCSPVRQNCLAD